MTFSRTLTLRLAALSTLVTVGCAQSTGPTALNHPDRARQVMASSAGHDRGAAIGQSPLAFSQLPRLIRRGDGVVISGAFGRVRGKLVRVERAEVLVRVGDDERRFECKDVGEILKLADSPWSGAIVGGLIGLLPAWNSCQNDGPDKRCVIAGLAVFAGIGAAIDRLHGQNRVVFRHYQGACD